MGNKKSGDLFTSEDFEMLRSLASQCAVAIENAKAYQLIEKLNANLEKRVEERTEELKKALDEHIARCAKIPWRLPNGMGPGELGEPNRP